MHTVSLEVEKKLKAAGWATETKYVIYDQILPKMPPRWRGLNYKKQRTATNERII